MKNSFKFRIYLLLTLLTAIVSPMSSLCDIIHLKSGGKIDGLIISEDSGSVIIDIGFGTTSVDTSEIRTIKRSNNRKKGSIQKKWENKYYYYDRFTPPQFKSFIERIRKLRAIRSRAIKRKRDLKYISLRIDSLEKIMENSQREYAALNIHLKNSSNKSYYERNQLINEAHLHNSSIVKCQQQLKVIHNDKKNGNYHIIKYRDSLDYINLAFNKIKKNSTFKRDKNIHQFITHIEKDLNQLKAEFKSASIDVTFTGGNHIIIPVKINGKRPVNLLLDTGASTITLSKKLSSQLGINWHRGRKINVTLANGEKVTGYALTLHSVSVESFLAKNVKAIILDKPPGPEIDGLLGMSYLDRFMVRIDAVNKKLELKDFVGR